MPVKFVAHINVETLEVTNYFYDEPGQVPPLIPPAVKPRPEKAKRSHPAKRKSKTAGS